MPKKRNIEDARLIPAVEVGKHFGYTKDYILLLVKQGKISGKKIGHKWFADLESAKVFFDTASREREERRKKISLERKVEFRNNQSKVSIAPVVTQVSARASSRKRSALVETCAVMLIGLTVGLLGYLVSSTQQYQVAATYEAVTEESFFKKLAFSLYDLFSPQEFDMDKIHVSTSTEVLVGDGVGSRDDKEVVEGAGVTDAQDDSVVVVPVAQMGTSTLREIANSFSDEVTVTHDPENSDMGVIVPKFKNREGEAYRFLMVPVQEHDQVKTDNSTS